MKNNDPSFFDNILRLSGDEGQSVSEPISIDELAKTLATCADSAPGPDGIPYSVIKAVWQTFGRILLDAWNYSLSTGKLPQSHKVSFLKLIPKAGKDAKRLTNWRPITLSNCDHKIITKVYARRVSAKIEKCIEERQTAYLKGRLINDNIRSILASINVTNSEENISGLLVSLDAKKAFDSVEHGYIEKVLTEFGLGSFVSIFRILYSELESDIIVNGRIVKGFKIKRGVKQGDALSCVLFIMCMEPLLKNIECNAAIATIRSNKLGCELPKLYAYADDVTGVIKNDLTSLQGIFNEYERLTNISGLQLNADKTEILPIKSSNVRVDVNNLYFDFMYEQRAHRVKACLTAKINGIVFQQDENELKKNNVAIALKRTDDHLKKWSRRCLSILGKILIVKTFGLSQLIFLMQSLSLSESNFKEIKHVLYKFIWNRHYLAAKAPERIKREITNKAINLGGLGMLDIEELDNSLKLKAFGRLKDSRHPMLCLLRDKISLNEYFFPEDKVQCDSVISKAVELLKLNRQASWQDRLLYSDKHYVSRLKEIALSKAVSNLGRNSLAYFAIRRLGITKVGELDGLQLENLRPFVTQHLFRAIKETLPITLPNVPNVPLENNFSVIAKSKLLDLSKKTSKEIRGPLGNSEPLTIFKIGVIMTPTEALSLFAQIRRLTNVRHKDMLLRLLHGELYCKEKLNRYGLITSPNCPRCSEPETLTHKYIECAYSRLVWKECLKLTNKIRRDINPIETESEKIFCCNEPDQVALTIHAEILLRIKALKDDADYLLLPKLLVKNAVIAISKRELKRELKEKALSLLDE